jgi:hypothetical protein
MRVVCVPGVLALLPQYASLDDPVADLRAAVRSAVAWLVEDGQAELAAATDGSRRVGRQLLGDRLDGSGARERLLVVANGSAKRTEKAPGHLDDRAEAFDKALGEALRSGDSSALAAVDLDLATELWADVAAFRSLGSDVDLAGAEVHVDYDDAPYGVQYWVVRWQCGS